MGCHVGRSAGPGRQKRWVSGRHVASGAGDRENPDDEPEYPARKFGHRILVNQPKSICLDQPVCIDHIIRGEGYDKSISIGRFLRGPRRLSNEKVRQLRSAAGADLAQTWLRGTGVPPIVAGDREGCAPLKDNANNIAVVREKEQGQT